MIHQISITISTTLDNQHKMASGRNLETLLEWVRNTSDEALNPSSHTFISRKITVKDTAEFGRSIYATEPIKPSELLLRIPPSFLLNSTTVIRHISAYNDSTKLTDPHYLNIFVPAPTSPDTFTSIYSQLSLETLLDLSSFQLLSLFITFESQRGSDSFWKPFLNMLPDLDDLRLTPLVWQVLEVSEWESLIKLLPLHTQVHAKKVHERFIGDYEKVVEVLVSQGISTDSAKSDYLPLRTFLWAWMCINSRCLYMDLPQSKNKHDNFTMAPYVDFLNHSSDNQCTLKINVLGFQVLATTPYQPEDQLFLSYGAHSNTFLLCEYGFVLPGGNPWNDLDITNVISPLLEPNHIDFLKERDYYGDYTINEESGVSFRTEVVLAVLQEKVPAESRRLNGLLNGTLDSTVYQKNSNILLKTILEKVIHDCQSKIKLEYNDDPDSAIKERKRVAGLLFKDMKKIAESVLIDL